MESELPHLVCIDDDVLSTGVTLYHLKVSIIFLYKALFYEVSLYQDQSVHDFKSGERKILEGTTLTSDQDRISPHNINTISSRQVMRIKENIS